MKAIVLGIMLALWGVPDAVLSGEMFNYGKHWLQIPPVARFAYIDGFVDGGNCAYHAAVSEWLPRGELGNNPESEKVAKVRKKTLIMLTPNAIIPVMTDLYKDPANAFIRTRDILFLARDKLLGEKIDDRLVSARREAVKSHEAFKKAQGLDEWPNE